MARLSPRVRLLLVLLILAAWAWRLQGIESQSLWRDEVDSLRFATRSLSTVLANFSRPGENGPLYFLLLRPWIAVMGQTEYALRFPSVWTGILALPLIFAWGRRLYVLPVALLAMLFLAVNPYHMWYSQEVKMYAVVVSVVMLALWAFVEAIERGHWWRWLIWLLVITTCIYIHVLGVLVIGVQIVWLVIVPRWRRRWHAFGLALLLLILPYLPLIGWQWRLLTSASFDPGLAYIPLPQIFTNLSTAQFQGIASRPTSWIYVPAIFLLLCALLLTRQWLRARIMTLTWWLLPPILVFLISLSVPLYNDRYLIWVLPALLLLLAAGALLLADYQRWLAVTVVLLIVGIQLWQGGRQATEPIKSNFRAAAAYVSDRRQQDDSTLFLIPYIRHTYQYYDPGDYPWLDAPYANQANDALRVPQRLSSELAERTGVWLVESEADFYDRDGLIRRWLSQNGRLGDEAHFTAVSVYYYVLDQVTPVPGH